MRDSTRLRHGMAGAGATNSRQSTVLYSTLFDSLSDCLDGTGIAGYHVIRGKQRDIFDLRLRYEHAVERVLVNRWQRPDGEHVFGSNL